MQLYQPFDTRLVQARLKAQVTALREVEGAAEYAALEGLRDFVAPCAYVLIGSESGSGAAGRVVGAAAEFGVVLAVSNYRDRRGEQLQPELLTLLGLVRAALIGWQPDVPGVKPVAWRGGAVMDFDDATLLWMEAYECTHMLQP
jgi:hypothetical protein